MPTIAETVASIVVAPSWEERIAAIRLIPAQHGTNEHAAIHAAVATQLYVPHIAPDYAYVHAAKFYEAPHFEAAYKEAADATHGFNDVSPADLATALRAHPRSLLPLRVITGLTKGEFAASTGIVGEALGLRPLGPSKVDSMERSGTAVTADQARVAAETIDRIMRGVLFGTPPGQLRSKQQKPDTENGWNSVRAFAQNGVPYALFLHQRHYGGAFRQLLDATSELRGNLLEDAVEALFTQHRLSYIRTGAHNQADVAARFGVKVIPAPDFVVYDATGTLRALLECKGANDGGTARDKALRFERLRAEANRLGGIPLLAVLGGLGWTRVNDTLGPVVRDCDGRVFSVGNLSAMLDVSPFPALLAEVPKSSDDPAPPG